MLPSWVITFTRKIGPQLQGFMEPTNKLDKCAVPVKGTLGKSEKFAETVFYFLKSDKNHHCKMTVTGKATNVGDILGMKVPCQLFFLTEEEFIIILQEKILKSFKI